MSRENYLAAYTITSSRPAKTRHGGKPLLNAPREPEAAPPAPCRREPPKVPETKVLEEFRGKVERIEGDIAYVSLVDRQGVAADAECPAADLTERGLQEGARFLLRVTQRGAETVAAFVPVARRVLSDEERDRLRRETEESLRDFPSGDDY